MKLLKALANLLGTLFILMTTIMMISGVTYEFYRTFTGTLFEPILIAISITIVSYTLIMCKNVDFREVLVMPVFVTILVLGYFDNYFSYWWQLMDYQFLVTGLISVVFLVTFRMWRPKSGMALSSN